MSCNFKPSGLWWYGVNNHSGRQSTPPDCDHCIENGTFIDWEFDQAIQSPKNGGLSTGPNAGRLTFEFDLTNLPNPILKFLTWWEIESVDADSFDLMKILLLDGSGLEHLLKVLNPIEDVNGAPDEPYTSAGHKLSPVWQSVQIDLSSWTGQKVKIVFSFDTGDEQYNGFREWLIESPQVSPSGLIATSGMAILESPEQNHRQLRIR